jgi:hypothetical protein
MTLNTFMKLLSANIMIGVAALYSVSASAQWTLSLPPPIQTAAYFAADNIGKEVAADAGRKDRARRGESGSSYTPPSPKISSATLTFTPNMQRRKDYFNALLAQYEQLAPGTAAQMRPLLFGENDGDIIQKIQKQIGPEYGMKTNNVADAYALYWIAAWETANGIFDQTTPPAQMKAVQTQVKDIMLSVPAMAALSDADKQSLAESLLTQAVVIGTLGGHVKADPANMPKVRAAALANAKAMGVNIEMFKLTPTGFELGLQK